MAEDERSQVDDRHLLARAEQLLSFARGPHVTDDDPSDKELLLQMQELVREVLRVQAVLEHRYFDDLHSRAVLSGKASDYEADLTVQRTFQRIVEGILGYDPQRGEHPRGWIRRLSDTARADVLREQRRVPTLPIEPEHGELDDPDPTTPDTSREIRVRKANEEATLKRSYQYFRCTVVTVEDLEGEDRDELREGPRDHPGQQRAGLRRAAQQYREHFLSCFGTPDPAIDEDVEE